MDPKIIKKLRAKGLKCTPQRLDIINGIIRAPGHCTVETIYAQAKAKDPGISASTVYRTLETLVEIGELKIVNVSRNKNFYDTKLDSHHHIICIKCGKIQDVEVSMNCKDRCLDQETKNHYTLIDATAVFSAICDRCRLKGI